MKAGIILTVLIACAPSCWAQNSTSQVVRAADKFLASLSEAQRQKVLFTYEDWQQRTRWSNFPTGMVPRGGISLKEMNMAQRAAAMDLLATVLSPKGLEKVNLIRQADEDLKEHGSGRGPGPPPPGGESDAPGNRGLPVGATLLGRPGLAGGLGMGAGPRNGPPFTGTQFGSDLYFISLLGNPSVTTPWMLQFGGHHLALNVTIAGSSGVLTPSLTGAQPAIFQVDGRTIRPLGAESDKAHALLQSLNDKQRAQAILGYRVADLILGPGQDDKRIVPEGLKASAMNEQQRAMLLDLIDEWAGIINEPAAAVRMHQIRQDLNDTWFAWSGPATLDPGSNITAYYRIQGPHLVIEYAPQRGDPTNHVHTIYRDPTNDYGRRLTAK